MIMGLDEGRSGCFEWGMLKVVRDMLDGWYWGSAGYEWKGMGYTYLQWVDGVIRTGGIEGVLYIILMESN